MPSDVFEFDSFRVEADSRRLLRDGEIIPISSRAFDVLLELIRRQGEIVSQEELISAVWHDQAIEPNNLSQAVKQIRHALGDTGKDHHYLLTVPRQGYKFVLPDKNKIFENGFAAPPTAAETDISNPPETEKSHFAEFQRGARSFWLKTASVVGLLLFVGIGAAYFWQTKSSAPVLNVKSIAVLPFVNFSAQAEDEVLGLGMADTLITKLGSLRPISVQPTGAIARFNQKERDIYEIGARLGVDAVLDGSYRREAGNLHVNVQLVDLKNKNVLWSDSFVENADNAVFIHERIAAEIAETLSLELNNDEKRFLAQRYTKSPEAWRLYLKAREIHLTAGADGFVQARALYNKAIELDRNFALAYVGLARTFTSLQGVTSPKQAYQIQREYARKALEIDDSLSEAHSTLAFALWRGEWNWREAETHFLRALELAPRFKRASLSYTLLLIGEARFDEAHAVIDRELRDDPDEDLLWAKATIWHYSKQFDQAEKAYLDISEKYPGDLDWRTGLVLMYLTQGRYAEAEPILEKVKVLQTVHTENNFLLPGLFYAKRGETARAREMLTEMHKLAEKKPGVWGAIALIHTALGEKDKAFEYLEKSIEEREHFGYLLKVNPLYDSLRDDPRFTEMLGKVNLAP